MEEEKRVEEEEEEGEETKSSEEEKSGEQEEAGEEVEAVPEEIEAEEELPELTDEQLAEFTAMFKSFVPSDGGQPNCLPSPLLGQLVRELGFMPSQADINSMLDNLDPKRIGIVELRHFLQEMRRVITWPLWGEDDIREAFRTLDRDENGFLASAQIRHLLTCLGEEMDEEDLDALIKLGDPEDTGALRYEKFVDVMFDPDPNALDKLNEY